MGKKRRNRPNLPTNKPREHCREMSTPVFDPPKILTLKKKVNPTLCSCISPCDHPYKPEMEQTEIHRFYFRSETGQTQKTTAALIRKRIEAARFVELKSYVYLEARNDNIRRDKSHLIGALVANIKDEDIDRFVKCFSSDGVIFISGYPLPIWCRQNFEKPELSAILNHDDKSNAKKKASNRTPERVEKEQLGKRGICETTDKLLERNKNGIGKSAQVHFKEKACSNNIVRDHMDELIENIDAQRIKIKDIKALTEADDIMNAVLSDVGREIERKEHERACETVNDLLLDLLNNVDKETRNREEIIVKETVCNFMDILMANVEADICRLAEQKQREHELKIAQIKADKVEWAVHELTVTVIGHAERELFIEDEEKIDGLVSTMVEEVVADAFLEVNDEYDRILNGIVSEMANKAIIDAQTELTDEYEQDLYETAYRISSSVIACVEAEENQEIERRISEKVKEMSERVITDCLSETVKELVAVAFLEVNNEYMYDWNLNGIVSELSNKAIKDAETELKYEYEHDLCETAYRISRSIIAGVEAEENQEYERRLSEKAKEMSERVISDGLSEVVKECEKQLWEAAFPNAIATDKVRGNNEKNNKKPNKTALDLTNISTEAKLDYNQKVQENATSEDQFARNQIDDAEVCIDTVSDIQETFQKVNGDIHAKGDLKSGKDKTDETVFGQIDEVIPDFKMDCFEEKEEKREYLMGEISPGAQREYKEKQSAINKMAAETKREFDTVYKIKYTEAKSVDRGITEDENTDGEEDTNTRETVLKMNCHEELTDPCGDMYEYNMFRIAYEQDVAADVTELAYHSNATVSKETETDVTASYSLMTPQDDVTEISPSFGIMALYVNSELHAFWGRE